MRAGIRMLRVAGGLLAAAVALAGCAGIPTSGAVGSAPIGTDDDGNELLTLAEGPQDGASPTQILTGFLIAQRAPQGNYSVAREFLTEGFRTEWSPTERVLVSDTPIVPEEQGGEDRLQVDVNVQAIVDATGAYTELERAEPQPLDYTFERNDDGEWRIASAPPGTVISSTRFSQVFSSYALYFFDPSWAGLVPDVRWFPDTASRADRIVKELLAGPSPWYQKGVLSTAFPSGTTLDPGVTVAAGTATVALSAEVAAQDQDAKWRMQQQLRLSLSALSDVTSVQMTAGGFPVQVGEGSTAESAFLVRSDPLGLAEGGFGYLTRATVTPVTGLSDRIESLGPLGVTLMRDGGAAAVRSAQGVWFAAAGSDPVLVDTRAGLIDPSVDARGFVWSAVGSAADSIIAVDGAGTAHPLSAPNLDGAIVSLDVSRDGARLLIGTQGAGGPGLTLLGIVRDGDGVPIGFGDPLNLTIGPAPLLDATWVDSSTVATLARGEESTQVDLYRIGGRHESNGTLTGGVQLVGGNFADGIRVLDGDGTVWRRNSSGGWQSTGIVASFLGTQQ